MKRRLHPTAGSFSGYSGRSDAADVPPPERKPSEMFNRAESDTNKWVLNIPMNSHENGAGAATIGRYLICLLHRMWEEGDEFSGKRPFGNSDWDYEIYHALIKAHAVPGRLGEEDYIEEFTDNAKELADKLISSAIKSLFKD